MLFIEKIKELRKETGVPLAKCKEALLLAHGDLDGAKTIFHDWELLDLTTTIADSKNGLVVSCIHNDRVGVLLDVRCQTESASKSFLFKEFCEQVMLQIVSTKPQYIVSDDVPNELLKKQRDLFSLQVNNDLEISAKRKPHAINMMTKRWLSEVCLMHQRSAIVDKKSMEDLRVELMRKIKEDVIVKRFARFELG